LARKAGSDARAMIEKLAETDHKDEIAEDGVVQTRKQKRSSVLVGHGKQQSAEDAEGHGQPVSENNVHKTEGQRAGQNHQEAAAKKRLVAVKEKGPVDKFLRINGEERVEKHDQKPEIRSALDQREEQLGSKDAYCQPQEDEEDGVTHQKRQELRTSVVPRSEMSEIKRMVAAKNQEGREGSKHQIRDGKVGQQAVIDEQGKADE